MKTHYLSTAILLICSQFFLQKCQRVLLPPREVSAIILPPKDPHPSAVLLVWGAHGLCVPGLGWVLAQLRVQQMNCDNGEWVKTQV